MVMLMMMLMMMIKNEREKDNHVPSATHPASTISDLASFWSAAYLPLG